MKTLVVLSGKGGAGKTSVAAALLPFASRPVLVDADVDASNLSLLVAERCLRSEPIEAAESARIDVGRCAECGLCLENCRFHALSVAPASLNRIPELDELACEGCGVCAFFCPEQAITLHRRRSGELFVSATRYGPLVHARLAPGGENSGALVEGVRREAQVLASETRRELVIVDGPPGVGCPAISALTGADLALVVLEATPSGEADAHRVLDLTRGFGIPAIVVINKADLDATRTTALAARVRALGVRILARLPYADAAAEAICSGRVLSESDAFWAHKFRELWQDLEEILDQAPVRA